MLYKGTKVAIPAHTAHRTTWIGTRAVESDVLIEAYIGAVENVFTDNSETGYVYQIKRDGAESYEDIAPALIE